MQPNSQPWTGRRWTLWTIAAVEGFSTLAVEVIAIRLAVPVVGSSITLTGVMLGVVLFALSAGYWRGGALSARWDLDQTRKALTRNLLAAAVLYGAIAFPFEAKLLEKALDLGLSLPFAIGGTATLLLLLPIYLASQTVPMLAELTNVDGHAGQASGKVLFFSTVGSVAGGIITPVLLFPAIGVERTTYVVCALLIAAAGVMAIGRTSATKAAATGLAALLIIATARRLNPKPAELYSFDSAYQSVRISEEKDDNGRAVRILELSGSRSSGVYADNAQTAFAYVRFAAKALADLHPKSVLVLGAAGFTFPRDAANVASVQRVDAVDVDPVVKPVAELHFLKQPLSPKIRFLPLSARYAVRKLVAEGTHYDFAFVDAYFGKGVPEELLTVEFFRDLHRAASRIAINIIIDSDFESTFSRNALATVREAFGAIWTTNVKNVESEVTNISVTNWPIPGSTPWNGNGTIYKDNQNSADHDHVAMIWNPDANVGATSP